MKVIEKPLHVWCGVLESGKFLMVHLCLANSLNGYGDLFTQPFSIYLSWYVNNYYFFLVINWNHLNNLLAWIIMTQSYHESWLWLGGVFALLLWCFKTYIIHQWWLRIETNDRYIWPMSMLNFRYINCLCNCA